MPVIVNLKKAPEHLETIAQWHQAEWSHLNPGETLEQREATARRHRDGPLRGGDLCDDGPAVGLVERARDGGLALSDEGRAVMEWVASMPGR